MKQSTYGRVVSIGAACAVGGGQATAKCKVVVKRGVPTPWGTVAWSTYSSIQRLSAKGNGVITYNRWE